nr:hypothetical transcript [Hymenolepis microstoma]
MFATLLQNPTREAARTKTVDHIIGRVNHKVGESDDLKCSFHYEFESLELMAELMDTFQRQYRPFRTRCFC